MSIARDLRLARTARRHGARSALGIIRRARDEGIALSLAFALAEQESDFRNVYGHDPVANPAPKGGKVTKRNYRAYKAARKRGLGMQGVGFTQLTWWEFQDEADAIGGCWKIGCQLTIAFRHVRRLIAMYGLADGLRRYNGSGPAAEAYSRSVRARTLKWHRILT